MVRVPLLLVLIVVCCGVAAGPAAAAVPRTVDRDADGQVDAIAGGARIATVPGARITGRERRGVTLAESGRPDSGTRPVVVLRGGRRVKAADGAPPAVLRIRRGLAGLRLVLSEPARVDPARLRVLLPGGRRVRPANAASHGTAVTVAAPPTAVGLAILRGALRDRRGNHAAPATRHVGPPAAAEDRPAPAASDARPASPAAAGSAPDAAVTGDTDGAEDTANHGCGGADGTADDGGCAADDGPDAEGWHTLRDPIDPRQQTALGFCDRSHYLQPWRAYLDTPPATALRSALGINLNADAAQLLPAATLLGSAGFSRARIEVGWGAMDPADTTRLLDAARLRATLLTLKANGLRPLILLNANHGMPTPMDWQWLTLTEPAPAGARTVKLDAASAAAVVPRLSGLDPDASDGAQAPTVLFRSVRADGTAVLSRPLPTALEAGRHVGGTLRFRPFGAPLTAAGAPNAAFEQTLGGWLDYVGAVTRTAASVVGDDGFDVEVWNELSFGSDFLDASAYYDPVPQSLSGTGSVTETILRRTVAHLRDPAHGVSRAGIGDGFANQTPFSAGSTSPVGLTALDKHPYSGPRREFDGTPGTAACRPLDALGRPDGTDAGGYRFRDAFTPRYTAFFPEYILNAIQTEHMVRDLSPITTRIDDVEHGRFTAPSGGNAPEVWMTETNIDPEPAGLTGDAARRVQAKAALRTLVAFVNKGVTRIDFYAAFGERFGLIDERRLDGGIGIQSLRRLVDATAGRDVGTRRALRLDAIADRGEVLVAGDGTAAHPDLHPRDWTAVLPFQSGPSEFKVAAYVMTRDVATDLDPVTERITLTGVDGATATVSAYDPLLDRRTPATIVARTATSVTVEAPLTDSVRVLTLTG